MKIEIDTPHGPALAHLYAAPEPAGALVLGHGAGGGFGAKDLVAATGAALEAGLTWRTSSSPTSWPAAALQRRRSSSTRRGPRSWSTCSTVS